MPTLHDEMVALALDGGLLWSRWALRRLGYFAAGRPVPLINDLVVERKTFRAGLLKQRLVSANLPVLEPRHQRSIGVAVGQRSMSGTFVVRRDGLEPCLDSDDLQVWPRDYRIGLAYGLWFDPDDRLTLTTQSLREALQVHEPVPSCAEELSDWVVRTATTRAPGALSDDWTESDQAEQLVRGRIPLRHADESAALTALADHIAPELPF